MERGVERIRAKISPEDRFQEAMAKLVPLVKEETDLFKSGKSTVSIYPGGDLGFAIDGRSVRVSKTVNVDWYLVSVYLGLGFARNPHYEGEIGSTELFNNFTKILNRKKWELAPKPTLQFSLL